MTGLFYPLHILYVKASEMAFEDNVNQGQLKSALEYGKLCLNAYRKYGGHSWRNVGICEYKVKAINKYNFDICKFESEILQFVQCFRFIKSFTIN